MTSLTDLKGIGPATAEKLRDDGIMSPSDLADAYRRNSPKVTDKGKRVRKAARDYLINEEGGFTDPLSGAEVDESNRRAFDLLAAREVSEFDSVSVEGANSSVFPDDEVRKFIKPVREGDFNTRVGGDSNLLGFAADAAENLGLDSLSSGELQELNNANETFNDEVTLRESSGATSTTTAKGDIKARDFIRALAKHQDRSPKARRVDNRKEAERTQDFDEWSSDPSRHDFPGVDTPGGAERYLPEERTKRKRGGFGSYSRRNEDRSTVKSAIEKAQSLNDEQQKRSLGEVVGDVDSPFKSGRFGSGGNK